MPMDVSGLGLEAWGAALAVLAFTALTLRMLQLGVQHAQHPRSEVSIKLAAAFSLLWAVSDLAQAVTAQPHWQVWSVLADQLRYASWFIFLLVLLRGNALGAPATSRAGLVVVALLVGAWGPLALALHLAEVTRFGSPARLVLFAALASPVLALVLLEQVFRNATEDARWNLKPLCLGLACAFAFDLYVFSQAVLFNRPDEDALSIRSAVHALTVPLLLLSSSRNEWLARIQLSPRAAFHSAALLLAGVYLLFISAVGYYVRFFGGDWGRALQLGLVVLALIVLMMLALSGTMRARLRVFLGKHFFRYRYDYREEWLKFTRALSGKNSPQELGQQVIRGLADMMESPGGGLWLRRRDEPVLAQKARWNMAEVTVAEPQDSLLCKYLIDGGKVVNLEEFRSFSRRYGALQLPEWLQDLPQAWLVVPLMAGDELIGFVVLASSRTAIDVNWEVYDLLRTAGHQAASYLAQMQATEALLEVRKFDAFNKMSAFVVHDLKNIVTQLSLMLKNAQRFGSNPEFQQDMLMTVENALERMRQLMLQLREGATPPGAAFGVNLETIVRRAQATAQARGRTLEALTLQPLKARGHEERLERIVGHVVQNAFDATPAEGQVSVTLVRDGSQARLEVRDTGHGMTPEFIRDRLFKPFQTTKQTGMGIGAYESAQYVRELGGKIEVTSEVGQGTTVSLLLPLFETNPKSDLTSMEPA